MRNAFLKWLDDHVWPFTVIADQKRHIADLTVKNGSLRGDIYHLSNFVTEKLFGIAQIDRHGPGSAYYTFMPALPAVNVNLKLGSNLADFGVAYVQASVKIPEPTLVSASHSFDTVSFDTMSEETRADFKRSISHHMANCLASYAFEKLEPQIFDKLGLK